MATGVLRAQVVGEGAEEVDDVKVGSLVRLTRFVAGVCRERLTSPEIGLDSWVHVHRISQKSVGLVQFIEGQDVHVLFDLIYGLVAREQLIVIVE